MERTASPRRRGEVDLAMISLMRDVRLRVSEAAASASADVERVRGRSSRVRVSGVLGRTTTAQ